MPTGLVVATLVTVLNTFNGNAIFNYPPSARMNGVTVENKLLE